MFISLFIPSVPQICGLAASRAGRGACVYRGLCGVCFWERWGRMSECQLSAIGRDRTNHSHWTDRYALFGLCGMAREPYHPQLCTHCLASSCMWSHTEYWATPIISHWTHSFVQILPICWLFVITWLQCTQYRKMAFKNLVNMANFY